MSQKYVISLPLLCSVLILGTTLWHAVWAPFAMNHPAHTRFALEKSNIKHHDQKQSVADSSDKEQSSLRQKQEARRLDASFNVEIYFLYDQYAEDIEWSLKDEGSHKTLAHYKANTTDSRKERINNVTVPAGKFVFEVKDSKGDGLCCRAKDYNGHYRLSVNGNLIAMGGEFADTTGPIKFQTGGRVEALQKANLGLQPHCLKDDTNKFSICLYLTTRADHFGNDWLPAFAEAKKRWETIVVGSSNQPVKFHQKLWQRPQTLGGIYITGEAAPIDGPKGILGSSGPRTVITTQKKNPVNHNRRFKQTLTGEMTFDSADIALMIKDHTYKDVIVHEMGHVLGIGTLWAYNGLHSGRNDDPVYNGIYAQREYKKLGFPGKLEVEIHHGEGTAGGHWDEECLRSELMTGLADPKMQLSTVTVGGMEDLGFDVNYKAADHFEVPKKSVCGQLISAEEQDAQGQVKRIRVLRGQNPLRRLSQGAREAAISYAELEMQKSRLRHEMASLPENVEFVGDQFKHVLIEEDGHIYSVTVHKKTDKQSEKEADSSSTASSTHSTKRSIVAGEKSPPSKNQRPMKVSGFV